MKRIRTKRLIIEPVDIGLVEKISAQTNDNAADHFLNSLSDEEVKVVLSDMEVVKNILMEMEYKRASPDVRAVGAWYGENIVGYVTILRCIDDIPEIQIEILGAYQHRGFGFELLFNLLKEIFVTEQTKYFRYVAVPTNKASIALVEKLGAELQTPKSEAEKILFKTYWIKREHFLEKVER